MYTCQVYRKHIGLAREAVGLDHTSAKKTSSSEKITYTAGNLVKKRRRRKKKAASENSNEQEPNGGDKARKQSGTQCQDEKVMVIKILKRGTCETGGVSDNVDKIAAVKDVTDGRKKDKTVVVKPSEGPCITASANGIKVKEEGDKFVGRNGSFDGGGSLGTDNTASCGLLSRVENKDGKKCSRNVPLRSVANKSENLDDSWAVKEVKQVKNLGGGSKTLFMNTVCLVLDQDADCQKRKPRKGNGPRNANTIFEGERRGDSARIEESITGSDDCTRGQIQTCVTRTTVSSECHVTDCHLTNCQEGPAVRKSQNKGRPFNDRPSDALKSLASASIDDQTRSTAARRGSFDSNAEKTQQHSPSINQARHNGRRLNNSQRRRRSSDGTSERDRIESEPQENDRFCANGKRVRRRSVDPNSEDNHRVIEAPENSQECQDESQRRQKSSDNDATGHELSESHRNCPTEDQRRRRFSDHSSENVSKVNGWFKKHQQPMDHQTRRRSINRASEHDSRGIDLPEANRDCPPEGQRRRKSSDNFTTGSERSEDRLKYSAENLRRLTSSKHSSENDSRVNGSFKKYQQSTDHRRRRRSFDCTSESDYDQGDIPENPRHLPDNLRRRKSSDRTSENDPIQCENPENPRHQPENRRSFDRTSESELVWGEIHVNDRHRPNNRRRRSSFDCTSESDPIQGEHPENPPHPPGIRNSFDHTSESIQGPEIRENPRHRPDNRRRRRSYDETAENERGRSKPAVNRRRFASENRDHIESENADGYTRGKVEMSAEPLIDVHDAVMNPIAGDEVFEDTSTTDKHVQEVKGMNAVNGQEISSGSQPSQFVIDPAVRERLLNPKYPVVIPDRPLEHISYRDKGWRPKHIRGANKSLVGGVFGSKWRKQMEKIEREREMKELAEEEKRKAERIEWGDNICPTFMVWGVCHRGDGCPLRHPSYRYLERPPRKLESPESRPQKQKQDPNSYAAVLGKSPEPKEFFNEAVLLAERATRVNETSFAKVLVNSGRDRQTSKVPLPKTSYEEAWPSLGSPVIGQSINDPKRTPASVPKAWTAQKGSWILEEKNSQVNNLQTASDAVIAQELQADEYSQIEEYDDYSYYPEEEYNRDSFQDSFHDQEPHFNEDEVTQSSFIDSHHQTKVLELEEFNSRLPTSPVRTEQKPDSPRESSPNQISSSPCDICMDRPKDATLVCGHRFCYQCALQMRLDERICAICRRCIVSVIKTYN